MFSLISKLYWRRFLSRNACDTSELDRFAALDPACQKADLGRRLLSQVQYFGKREDALPEWQEAARISDPDALWQIWPSLPIMSKQMVLDRFPAGEIGKRFHIEGQIRSTGGSTGEPTHFFHDTAMLRASVAGNYYTRKKMGWAPGMATVIIWGSERDIGKQIGDWKSRTQANFLRDCLVDGYRLTNQTVSRVMEMVEQNRPVAMYGFTSMLEFVARTVVDEKRNVPAGWVQTAWNGGEMLFPEQSAIFKKAFGVPILNRYGGRELSTIACQYDAGGPLQVLRPWVFLELVDGQGKPCGAGESGRVLLTSTICRGTPFLRYEVGDIAIHDSSLSTEAGIIALQELQGRTAGTIRLPDGRTIVNLYWNHLFKEFPEVRQFQVRWKDSGELRIALVGTKFSPDREKRFWAMTATLLSGVKVQLDWTLEIPRSAQGKLVQVVRESN